MVKHHGIDRTLREIVRESKRRKVNDSEIRRLYRGGMSRKEVAEQMRISYATVHRHTFGVPRKEVE